MDPGARRRLLHFAFWLSVAGAAQAAAAPYQQDMVGSERLTQDPSHQSSVEAPRASGGPGLPAIVGPPAPVPPLAIARDAQGRATFRAVRLPEPLHVDGRLDEAVYREAASAGGFLQQLPREGEPATERTDVWVFFDEDNLYIAARCWDSQPDRWILSELRRDHINILRNENITVVLDTFYDRRNAFFFQTSLLGALRDQTITDGLQNDSWNTVWDTRSAPFDGGWATEIVVPFKSLRYLHSGPQVWGINIRRVVAWKNETSTLTRLPAAYGGPGIGQMDLAATLVGLETPSRSRNIELKPYALSSVTTDNTAVVPFANDATANAGVDFKYGITRSLIADATLNTDFAQVEEDVQQVNLTRFSLFFPEKRDFFLEGQGIFAFGGRRIDNRGGGGGNNDVPIMFFSRRIGLSNGQSVPVVAGGRITGRVGAYTLGVMNIETGDKASAGAVATNFTAARVKRDILRRSDIGFIVTNRAAHGGELDASQAFGADTNLRVSDYLTINAYYARTSGPAGSDDSYRSRFEYAADRYGLTVEHLKVGDRFDPTVGFLRRDDFHRTAGEVRFSPRLRQSETIRKLSWEAGFDYVTDAAMTRVENRQATGTFQIEFHNSDVFGIRYAHDFELLPEPFRIAPGVTLDPGGYEYDDMQMSYEIGQQRTLSGTASVARGSFYDGTKTEVNYSGRLRLTSHVAIEPGVSLNWVDLPDGQFTTRLTTARIIIARTARMLISSLAQYNASAQTLSLSARFRWEYKGGSELFLVYSDGRDTGVTGVPDLLNRSVAVKVTRLLRF